MGKNIIVIGGSKGIGRVFVDRRVKRGDNVYVFARNFQIRNKKEAHFIKSDLTNQKKYLKKLKELLKKIKKVDAIVFAQRYRGIKNIWKNERLVSIETLNNSLKLIDKYMSKKNSSIIVVSSNASTNIAIEQPVSYHMAKAAISQIAKYYAVKFAKKKIRVNIISPTITLKPENIDFYNSNKIIQKTFSDIIPLGRMAHSDDICNVIDFLISNKSSFITGQTFVVDGGLSLLTPEVLIRSSKGL